jgi:hypothetical protein
MNIRGLYPVAMMAFLLTLTAVAGATDSRSKTLEKIAFVRKGNIWVARADGSGEHQLTNSGTGRNPSLSPDGKQIAFHQSSEKDIYPDTGFGQLYLVDTAGGKPQKMRFDGILAAEDPSFSPDGKNLLFTGLSELRKQGKQDDLQAFATMSISVGVIGTGKSVPVLQHKNTMLDAGYLYANPLFSPDGKLVLWQQSGSDVSGGFEICDLKGKRLFRYPLKKEDSTPYWGANLASDGQTILCYSPATSQESEDKIYLIDRKTSRKVAVSGGTNPVFIRNGKAIIFERWENRWSDNASSNLWVLELKPGAVPKQIVTDASEPAGVLMKKREQRK